MDSKWEYRDKKMFIEKFGEDTYNRINREDMIEADLHLRQDLMRQYMCLDIDKIFNKFGEERVISFANQIVKNQTNEIFYKGFSYHSDTYGHLSYETKKEFYDLSLIVNEKLNEEYNVKDFLKMCRVCFDSAPKKKYADDVSDYYVYADENDLTITDDYRILGAIGDNENIGTIKEPDFFDDRVKEFYSNENNDYKKQIKGSSFGLVKHKKGAYKFDINIWYVPDMIRGMLMYIGLRNKGYNISVDAVKVLKQYERYSLLEC